MKTLAKQLRVLKHIENQNKAEIKKVEGKLIQLLIGKCMVNLD